jgi:hypothetical protein
MVISTIDMLHRFRQSGTVQRRFITLPREPAMAAALAVLLALAACGVDASVPTEPASTAAVPDWRDDPSEPFPFVTPVPALAETPVDGAWDRDPTDTSTADRAHCVRCPPYPKDRGRSLLRLDQGRWEVIHGEPAYRGYGHYTVDGDTITLFNDPECSDSFGTYRWAVDDGALTLTVLDDPCGFGQRSLDLTAQVWVPADPDRCRPPDEEAAVTDHWPAPAGC